VDLRADILALQEVDVGVPRSQHADLARIAAEACGMNYYFAKARRHNYRGAYGNALLVRGAITEVEVVRLRGDHRHTYQVGAIMLRPFREPRNAIIATAQVDDRQVSIGTGHFAAEPGPRRAQLDRATAKLVERARPRILLGDFNIPWPQAAAWLAPHGLTLVEAGLDESRRAGIDHVAVDGLLVERVETRWLSISDHPAKIVELRFAS
jgi:endonuclease/exonuclease/phosphatase family metal-dependent hydrolase